MGRLRYVPDMAHLHITQRTRKLVLAAGFAAAALTAPVAAQADSLVFVKDGDVWIARSDGTQARAVTASRNNWAWPSMADDGTIWVAGGKARVNPDGSDSDGGTEIYHFGQDGTSIGPYVETFGSHSTSACPTDAPTYLRVSPDGTRASFNQLNCDNRDSFYEDLSNAHQTRISSDYSSSQWLDAGHILITHIGPEFDNATYASYDVANPANSHGPTEDPYLPEKIVVASRSGNRVAVYEANANIDGSVHDADIRLYTTTANDVTEPVAKCTVPIDAGNAVPFILASPALSPDGSRLAWAEKDGVHLANTADLENCASVTRSLALPGGATPFFGTQDPQVAPVRTTVAVRSPSKRAKLPSSGRLKLTVSAGEEASITGRGSVKIGHHKARFRAGSVQVAANQPARLTLKLSRSDTRKARKALKHHALVASLVLTASAPNGHTGKQALLVTLRR